MKYLRGKSITVYCLSFFWLVACDSPTQERKEGFDLLSSMDQPSLELDGKALAEIYCQACHLFPDPSLLDQKTWRGSVLPDMRRRMGLITEEDFGEAIGEDNDAPPGTYAVNPLISMAIWEKIQDYYVENAPSALPKNSIWEEGTKPSELFDVHVPKFQNKRPSLTTLIRYNEHDKMIYLGDRLRSLFRIDPRNLVVADSILIPSPGSEIGFVDGGFYLLTMGVMDPSNSSTGKLSYYDQVFRENVILENLTRPVHFSQTDLFGKGANDWLVSSFGNHVGHLSIFADQGEGMKEQILNASPGARRTIVSDVNGDGRPDILAMMTQAKEGLYAYINLGEGKFKEEKWLEFHPVFGSSDFAWEDMNGDGLLDLVIVNGDNADLSPIEKPYHGVRVFLNGGNNAFSESYFFSMNGASGLAIADFDGNGRLDIAAISYFPQMEVDARRNFVLLMQDAGGGYSAQTVQGLEHLSFLVLDKADVDQDGDMDLLLGSFDFKSMYAFPSWNWTPFVFLENKSSK